MIFSLNNKGIQNSFYFFVFFPYLSMIILISDTSLYALFFSLIIFIYKPNQEIPRELQVLFMLFISSIFVSFINNLYFLSIKSILRYLSLFVIAYSTYYLLINNLINYKKLFYRFTQIWFTVALIQFLIYKEFLTFILPRYSSSVDRGVTSLATEPTLFGLNFLLILIISYITNFKFKETFLMTLMVIFILAKSSTSVMIFLIILTFYFILNINKKTTFLLITIVSFLFFIVLNVFNENNRLAFILMQFTNGFEYFMMLDGSINTRIWHVLGPIIASYNNYFLPNGFGGFGTYIQVIFNNNLELVHQWTLNNSIGDLIMSGLGQIIYELGIFFLLYIYSLFMLAYKAFRSLKKTFIITLSFFTIMISSISIATPFFGFIYGLLAYKAYRQKENIN